MGIKKNLVFIFLIILSLSSTITVIPDIIFPLRFDYIGYTLIPLLIFIYIFLSRIKFTGTITYLSIVFMLIYFTNIFIGFKSGSKSLESGVVFFISFLIFSLTINTRKFNLNSKLILQYYGNIGLIISFLVTLIFVFLELEIINLNNWYLENPINEKFAIKEEFHGKNAYSFPGYLSLIFLRTTKIILDFNSNPYGAFNGLSYESSLGLLFSTVAIFLLLGFTKNKYLKSFFLIILLIHVILGLSLTNILSLLVVIFLLFGIYYKNRFFNFSLPLILIILLYINLEFIFQIDFFVNKINSRSYDDSTGFVLSFFGGGLMGEGVFTQNFKPGIITSVLIFFYYIVCIGIIRTAIKKREIGVFLALSYMIIHSLKFPYIFIQLPFAYWIPALSHSYVASNKNN